jgi:1,4-alpha-glucan branching enzyme
MKVDLLTRRETKFVFWRPRNTATPPNLVIGRFQAGNPPTLVGEQTFNLTAAAGFPDLWELAASACGLTDGQIYHYWFEIDDSDDEKNPKKPIRIADPAAFTVDWRLVAAVPDSPAYNADDQRPASVIRYQQGKLVPCDPGGEVGDFTGDPALDTLPPNRSLVIYEMPTAWSRIQPGTGVETAAGTFRDVLGLVEEAAGGANFSDLSVVQPGETYLSDLGVNCLELLPPADSFYRRTWDYGTSNFFAPDHELGFPENHASPTANADLTALVLACHKKHIRFFVDVVLAFGKLDSYKSANFPEFHIDIPDPAHPPADPDALTSGRGNGRHETRQDFGGTRFRYSVPVDNAYDPVSGEKKDKLHPVRQHMKASLVRWMRDFRVDGWRMDSVENVANWDFVQEFRDLGHQLWKERWDAQHLGGGADDRFLVVGEELEIPMGLLTQKRLDGLWHEPFKRFVRAAIRGVNNDRDGEQSFEWTVRRMVDCRHFGFAGGHQAIIYLTSHDVGGFGNERLFNYLNNNGIWDTKKRIMLAFSCLLTAVGIPMILAGEEFADQHNRFDSQGNVSEDGGKQVDPVNYSRAGDDWRKEILRHVTRLVQFRTTSEALAGDEVEIIHIDFNDNKRVLSWRRGAADSPQSVVVVANFSDFTSDHAGTPQGEYVIHNWPATPEGRQWKEVTQDRIVPPEWVGREPVFAWEAKVYTPV